MVRNEPVTCHRRSAWTCGSFQAWSGSSLGCREQPLLGVAQPLERSLGLATRTHPNPAHDLDVLLPGQFGERAQLVVDEVIGGLGEDESTLDDLLHEGETIMSG